MSRLFLFAVALIFASVSAFAYSEAEGHDIYQRGYYEEALVHWEAARKRGDAGAAYRLAEEYLDAKIVKRDIKRAVKYLNQAAKADEPRALTELAGLYDYGTGVRRDRRKAGGYYLRAAKLGMPAAMFNVASMLELGESMPRDRIEAYKYYLLSRDLGFAPFADTAIEGLTRSMRKEDIAEAKRRADTFVPRGN